MFFFFQSPSAATNFYRKKPCETRRKVLFFSWPSTSGCRQAESSVTSSPVSINRGCSHVPPACCSNQHLTPPQRHDEIRSRDHGGNDIPTPDDDPRSIDRRAVNRYPPMQPVLRARFA